MLDFLSIPSVCDVDEPISRLNYCRIAKLFRGCILKFNRGLPQNAIAGNRNIEGRSVLPDTWFRLDMIVDQQVP